MFPPNHFRLSLSDDTFAVNETFFVAEGVGHTTIFSSVTTETNSGLAEGVDTMEGARGRGTAVWSFWPTCHKGIHFGGAEYGSGGGGGSSHVLTGYVSAIQKLSGNGTNAGYSLNHWGSESLRFQSPIRSFCQNFVVRTVNIGRGGTGVGEGGGDGLVTIAWY